MNMVTSLLRSIRTFRLPAIVLPFVALVGGGRAAAQPIQPVESFANNVVQATTNTTSDPRAQATTMNPFSSSATVTGGNGLGGTATAQGTNGITWTNAASGTVTFQNIGISANNSSGSDVSASYDTRLRYTFQGPDAPATLSIDYTTTGNSVSGYAFVINSYVLQGTNPAYVNSFVVDNGTSGTYTYQFATLAPGNGNDGYGFEIYSQGASAFGNTIQSYSMDGSFSFSVTPVPEPGSVLLAGTVGVGGWAVRRRRAAVRSVRGRAA